MSEAIDELTKSFWRLYGDLYEKELQSLIYASRRHMLDEKMTIIKPENETSDFRISSIYKKDEEALKALEDYYARNKPMGTDFSQKDREILGLDKDKNVDSPRHYKRSGMECIDAIVAATQNLDGPEGYMVGNAIKYLWRWKEKNGREDLLKAKKYIEMLVERLPLKP